MNQKAFTLVELLVTLSIVSILAVMASGSYISYVGRTQTSEVFSVVENLQANFKAHYQDADKFPPNNLTEIYGTEAGALPGDHMGRYVSAVDLDGGVIVATFGIQAGAALTGKTLTLEPYETPIGSIIYKCGTSPIPLDGAALPLSVAGTSVGSPITGTAAVSNVPAELLPGACK